MNNRYGNVIWTNHALSRLVDRGIRQEDAWYTLKHPQTSEYAKTKGAWVYRREYGDARIEVVAKQNELKEWVVISVWSESVVGRPPQRLSFFRKFLQFIGF